LERPLKKSIHLSSAVLRTYDLIKSRYLLQKSLKFFTDLGYTLTSPNALAAQNPSFDLVVDCSGSAAAMQQAIKWLNMGGKLMVFGVANPKAVME